MDKSTKIYIAGHKGLVGSAITNKLAISGYTNLITKDRSSLDLTSAAQTLNFFAKHKPNYIILAAARVGGIAANNKYPADFITTNIAIQTNIIRACHQYNATKLLFLGSSCIYPRDCLQPMKESSLMTGELEKTNSAYAMAKLCGIEMCKAYNKQYNTNFICAMPCNLFGENDNYDLENSHVLAAMLRKFHEAKINNYPNVELWGSGNIYREFLYADDLADGLIFLLENYDARDGDNIINIGMGKDLLIKELADLIKNIVGYNGKINWNKSMPDGTPRKLLDCRKINQMGWAPKYNFVDAIRMNYKWFIENYERLFAGD